MQVSEAGRALIKTFEGLRLEAYQDQVGKWTIGYGSTRGVKPGDKVTEAQADERLADDLLGAEAAIARLAKVKLTQSQFDGLASFVFNLGEMALAKSTLLRLLNQRRFREAAEEFPKWCYAGGVPVDGLKRRREAERAMFLSEAASQKEGA